MGGGLMQSALALKISTLQVTHKLHFSKQFTEDTLTFMDTLNKLLTELLLPVLQLLPPPSQETVTLFQYAPDVLSKLNVVLQPHTPIITTPVMPLLTLLNEIDGEKLTNNGHVDQGMN